MCSQRDRDAPTGSYSDVEWTLANYLLHYFRKSEKFDSRLL